MGGVSEIPETYNVPSYPFLSSFKYFKLRNLVRINGKWKSVKRFQIKRLLLYFVMFILFVSSIKIQTKIFWHAVVKYSCSNMKIDQSLQRIAALGWKPSNVCVLAHSITFQKWLSHIDRKYDKNQDSEANSNSFLQ